MFCENYNISVRDQEQLYFSIKAILYTLEKIDHVDLIVLFFMMFLKKFQRKSFENFQQSFELDSIRDLGLFKIGKISRLDYVETIYPSGSSRRGLKEDSFYNFVRTYIASYLSSDKSFEDRGHYEFETDLARRLRNGRLDLVFHFGLVNQSGQIEGGSR